MASTSILWCAVGSFTLMHMVGVIAEFPCENTSLCKSEGDACCENANGRQWCCAKTEKCCNEATGCCANKSEEYLEEKKSLFKNKFLKLTKNKLKATNFDKFKKHDIQLVSFAPKYKKCDKQGFFYCPSKETCCESSSGLWKCCQYENATCCVDKENCCPANTTCVGAGCSKLDPALNLGSAPVIFCPGRKQACPTTFTCCLTGNDTYGCCPYQNAVCCSDLTHCCPPSTRCDVKKQKCVPSSQ